MQSIKRYYIIPAEPELIYIALTNEATTQLWTGAAASVDAREGGAFSLWDGAIVGVFKELVPDKLIVQQWYFDGETEESIVTIKLHPHKKGTSLELVHTNVPDEVFEEMSLGWDDPFMASLIEFYED